MAADAPARSAMVGSSDAPNTLTVYFSLSCPHCLQSIEAVHNMVETMVRERKIAIELVEVPGMIGKPPDTKYDTIEQKRRAIRNGYQASLVYSCAASMEPEVSWRRIESFYYALRQTVDPERFDYADWAFAEPEHLTEKATKPWPNPDATQSGTMIAAYYYSRLQVGTPPYLEMQQCVSAADQRKAVVTRLDAQMARFKSSGFKGVPIYLWNGVPIRRSKFEEIMRTGSK